MNKTGRNLTAPWRFAAAAALLLAAAQWTAVSAQNPGTVFVEGNCDSPVFGTTLVASGTCGDFDGDGRIGTAEDGDGADFIYGTINAALTAIAHNGKVVIVKSGRFHENVYIGQQTGTSGGFGALNPGNVTLEGAPGVEAVIDAFAQADSAANNNARASSLGISVTYTNPSAIRIVTLRNLQVRNYAVGVGADNLSRVNIEGLRVENNLNTGIRISNSAWAEIVHTHVKATGFRLSGAPGTPNPGYGIHANQTSVVRITGSTISHNISFGVFAAATADARAVNTTIHFNNNSTAEANQTTNLLDGNLPIFDN